MFDLRWDFVVFESFIGADGMGVGPPLANDESDGLRLKVSWFPVHPNRDHLG